EAIAAMLGEDLVVDPALEAALRAFFANRGRPMPERNVKQATVTLSTSALPNPNGTAPGWWVERSGRLLVAMPGVPHEMRRMWEHEVAPRLRPRVGGEVIRSRLLKVIGLGESDAEERIRPLLASDNPTIGTYAKEDGIHLRLTARAADVAQAEGMLEPLEQRIRDILGLNIYGAGDETLPGVVGRLLIERGLTLATMESCTGGLVASHLTDSPGSSAYFAGGLVSYSDASKVAFGVSEETLRRHGAVSPEMAGEMAAAARRRLGASVGLAVTGVAGPAEQEGKPVGTVYIALDGPIAPGGHLGPDADAGRRTISRFFPVARSQVKRLAMLAALDLLRRALLADRPSSS
ncbi:MAG: CinA family nicotinamide mononucleotide deamidase-related protein, partial [Chloroflexota bacterium]